MELMHRIKTQWQYRSEYWIWYPNTCWTHGLLFWNSRDQLSPSLVPWLCCLSCQCYDTLDKSLGSICLQRDLVARKRQQRRAFPTVCRCPVTPTWDWGQVGREGDATGKKTSTHAIGGNAVRQQSSFISCLTHHYTRFQLEVVRKVISLNIRCFH